MSRNKPYQLKITKGWGGGWQVWFHVGVQSFTICIERDTKAEAKFIRDMFAKAIEKLLKEKE